MNLAAHSSKPGIQLIVGLGNPGSSYADHRHNVGYWLAEKLCKHAQQRLQPETKFKGLVAKITLQQQTLWVLEPTTYMNLSGQSVQQLCQFYKIQPQQILVVHDELDLPAGWARLKFNGGHGGHNGIRDIIAKLGTNAFYRLRIGIGHPGDKDKVHDYVLHRPSLSDKQRIDNAIDESVHILPMLVTGQIEKAMTQLHTTTK